MGRFILSALVMVACAGSNGAELVIDLVDPASGPSTSEVAVRIEGSGFRLPIRSDVDDDSTVVGDMAFTVGNIQLLGAAWRGESLIVGSIPTGLAIGPHDVTVTLGDLSGVLPNGYEVVDPLADRDADGVIDATDVCPDVADAAQADHDADLRGDVCDRCPHIADAADPDQDGDGVGDPCDPRPTLLGDQRVAWFGFYASEAAQVMAWPGSGTWTVTDGWLDETGTATTGFDWKGPPNNWTRAYAATAVRFNAMQGTSWTAAVATGVVGTPPSPQQFYECFTLSGGTSPFVSAQSTFGRMDKPRPTIAPGAVNAITISFVPMHACKFVEGSFTETTSIGNNQTGGRVHLSSQRATVSFDYLFIVEIGS